jgi:hypothetical protein
MQPIAFVVSCLVTGAVLSGQVYAPEIEAASKEGRVAIRKFKIPSDLEIKLVAAEPMLANPVAFCFDNAGRIYIAETFRLHKGVTDNREHKNWLDEELACRTVADRVKMYERDPGIGLPSRYRDHFFLCEFRGTSSISGVLALECKPKGAGFELTPGSSNQRSRSTCWTTNRWSPASSSRRPRARSCFWMPPKTSSRSKSVASGRCPSRYPPCRRWRGC